MVFQSKPALIVLAFVALSWNSDCLGQATLAVTSERPEPSPQTQASASGQTHGDQPSPGSISGTVIDQSGAVVAGARVMLTPADPAPKQKVLSDNDGRFSFAKVPSGAFELTIDSPGFAAQTFSGILDPGETDTLAPIMLAVAADVTEVQVGVPQVEVAEEQIKVEEQQRVLGAIPNFYVSYIPDAAPLTAKQKFELAWKSIVDPFTFVVVGGAAGVEQAQNHFVGYGQGAQGYAKRFGAGYADAVAGTFIGGAILPSLLKQDPRYFYKGTGSIRSRSQYAIAMAFICKGDNRRWQVNYSAILGSIAAGGISNLYYPSQNRGADLTFENAGVGIISGAASNLLQEFLIRKLTPKAPKAPSKQ